MAYKNILLVDDDPDDAEIFIMALNAIDEKIKGSVESNALDALKKLKEKAKLPDIIFLDYYMPYLDGSEFLTLLREIKGFEKIPVILYSGQSAASLKSVTDDFKNVRFLKKNSDFKKIIRSLKEIISED